MPLSCAYALAGLWLSVPLVHMCIDCPYVYRWVNIFARSVPVYALVNGYTDVYVYVRVCVYVSVHEYAAVAVAVYVCVNPSIHLCARTEN